LVAHPGSGKESGIDAAVSAITQGIKHAARGLKLGDLRILLENTAGQGTCVGSRFEELKAILDGCGDLPMGVCIDTAHTFAAGWDIRTAEGLETTLRAIDRTIGLARVYVIHTNDSKTALGSRVDRHENIGKGKIGLEAFGRVLSHPLLAGKAFILETPIDKPGDDRRNVAALWKLVGRTVTAKRGAGMKPRPHRSKPAAGKSAKAFRALKAKQTRKRGK
jgi:deoxyribonuclease-4